MAKILLAEDDLFLRDIYEEILKEEFEVTVVSDGTQALEELKKGGWDLVLLDVIMPQMSGVDVLRAVKDSPPKTLAKHIVFMTNTDEAKELKDVKDFSDGYMLKSSFTPGQLLEKVKQYLGN